MEATSSVLRVIQSTNKFPKGYALVKSRASHFLVVEKKYRDHSST